MRNRSIQPGWEDFPEEAEPRNTRNTRKSEHGPTSSPRVFQWDYERILNFDSIQQPIPVIALMRLVAEITNQPPHVVHCHPECGSRLRDDILLNHDAP